MKSATATVISSLALFAAVWCATELRQTQRQLALFSPQTHAPLGSPDHPPSATSSNLIERLNRLEAAVPTVGVFMNVIQTHFAKMYYAAEARNWALAEFERGEIVENLDTVVALKPEENSVSLAGITEAFKNTQLTQLKDAIDVKDRRLFRDAYEQAVLMCNTCHQSTGRPFIHITIPTNPPVPNQQWALIPPGGAN